MAYPLLRNPQAGGPGQPEWLNYWSGNTFVMPGPQSPPAPQFASMAPAVTPQDTAANREVSTLSRGGGLLGDSGGTNQLSNDPSFASPMGRSSTPNTPANFSSNFGPAGGLIGMGIGMGTGVPGVGAAMGAAGGYIDANRYGGVLDRAGIPHSMNPWEAALSQALPGVPFTDWNLGSLFGVNSARQQSESARRDALAQGTLEGNVAPGMNPGPLASAFSEAGGAGAVPGSLDLSVGGPFDLMGMVPGLGQFGGYSPAGTDSYGNTDGSAHASGDTNVGGTAAYARGGKVRKPMSGSYNPPGPDDQIAAVQSGEGLLTRAAMKRHPGLLGALNKGDTKKARGLLGGAR